MLSLANSSSVARGPHNESFVSGIFVVVKDADKDRALTDRRRQNWGELDVITSPLASAAQLTRLTLADHLEYRVSVSDLPEYFHMLSGGETHALANPIGHTFSAEELCLAGVPVPDELMHSQAIQPCLLAIAMGDKKAVAIAQEFHLQLLRQGNYSAPLLSHGSPVPSASSIARGCRRRPRHHYRGASRFRPQHLRRTSAPFRSACRLRHCRPQAQGVQGEDRRVRRHALGR
jgi:hypothetical protein